MTTDSKIEAPQLVATGDLVRLSGLQKLCKLYGRMKCGDTMMAWDYVNNVALPEAELRKDKARWAASERAKYGVLPNKEINPSCKSN